MMSMTCHCGCGRPQVHKRLGPSHYEVWFDGRRIGTVQKETRTIEQSRPGRYRQDAHWVNSRTGEWSMTRSDAIGELVMAVHAVTP